MIRRGLEWLDDRTGWRRVRSVLLDERLPAGTGWFFTLGSVLLGLLGVQLLTGAFLTLYYAPTPDHAYESIRYISAGFAGRLVRGLHHYGASFLVVAVVVHLLRVLDEARRHHACAPGELGNLIAGVADARHRPSDPRPRTPRSHCEDRSR